VHQSAEVSMFVRLQATAHFHLYNPAINLVNYSHKADWQPTGAV